MSDYDQRPERMVTVADIARLETRVVEMTKALQLARLYLAKAHADGLMADCVMPLEKAIERIDVVLEGR